MKQYNLNQVFEDTKNFPEPKRLKCVEGDHCNQCGYVQISPCDHGVACTATFRTDGKDVYFIETDEPLTTPYKLVVKPINHKPHKLFEKPYEYYT